jgi:predicted MFS family arabinose efflux permease
MVAGHDSLKRIIPALAISAIGALFYNVLPLYVGAAQDHLALSNGDAGLLPAAFFAGYNLATIAAFFWIRRWNWRTAAAFWLPVALLGLIGSVTIPSTYALFLSTAISGSGFAVLYGIGTTILADTSNPTRWYGFKIALEAVPGACLLFILPTTLVPAFGFVGVIGALVGVSLFLALFLLTLPTSSSLDSAIHSAQNQVEGQLPTIRPLAIGLVLLGTLLFFSSASGLWAFIERIGAVHSFPASDIGQLLSLTLVLATLGSLTTAWLGKRLGNVGPFTMSASLIVAACFLLYGVPDFPLFALGAGLLTFAIGMGLPFAIAEVAELDVDGRYIILTVPAIGLGAMIGPATAGILSEASSFDAVLWAGALTVLGAIGCVVAGRVMASNAMTTRRTHLSIQETHL